MKAHAPTATYGQFGPQVALVALFSDIVGGWVLLTQPLKHDAVPIDVVG